MLLKVSVVVVAPVIVPALRNVPFTVLVDPVRVNVNVCMFSVAPESMVRLEDAVTATPAVTSAAVFEMNKNAKLIPPAEIACAPDPSNKTALEFAVKVPLLVQFPPMRKSPPEAVDSAKNVDALIVKLPLKRRYCVLAPKLTLVDAVDIVTLNGTPCPVRAFGVHSVPAP